MNYFWAFVVGGGICVIGQLLIDLTGLTPARILTGYVVAGVILSAVGWYGPLAEFAGCGATVPPRQGSPPALCAESSARGWERVMTRIRKTSRLKPGCFCV